MFERLKKRFFWQPSLTEFTVPLRVGTAFKVRVDRFPKGVDNVHIDVVLSPEFQTRARLLARRLLLHELAENYPGEPPPAPEASEIRAIQEGYAGMMELTIDRARRSTRPELIQLLQFATIKFLLCLVSEEYARLRSQLQRSRDMGSHQSSGCSVELHDQLVNLTKEGPALLYRVSSRLFREILKLEDSYLSKLRKSVFGRAWQVPRQLLFNPLLKIPSLWADEQLMHHYSLVCTDKDDADGFAGVNRLLSGLFSDYLPPWAWPLEHSLQADAVPGGDNRTMALRQHRDQGVLLGFLEIEMLLASSLQGKEYERGLLSWLDFPANLERIFYSTRWGAALDPDHEISSANAPWLQSQWPEFHHRLLKRIFCEIRRTGLERKILACNAAPGVFEGLNGQLPVRTICRYLEGVIRRRDMLRRLESMQSLEDPAQAMRLLNRAQTAIQRQPASRRRSVVLRFLIDFALFRRDLKLAYRAHWIMNRIRLLERPHDIDLSRNNRTLHEFVLREESKPEQQRVRDHVIIKADLRGSTTITGQLTKRNLNPASHFSLNFFEPINRLLSGYGAKKVFVEGDAVILAILEYEDKPYHWLCVSHACGLAGKILQAMDAGNARSHRQGLPELELGLGIAFSDQAPTFLYDEDREIMISPAINRADQLSSCSAMLRQSMSGAESARGVEVLAPAEEQQPEKESSDRLLRYNVNGIELDAAAFQKLKSELALKRIPAGGAVEDERFHVGRYPDLQGTMHWLVIRESPVRVWEDGAPGAVEWRGRRFYQVITDTAVIRRLTDKGRTEVRGTRY
jgi:hypothetical protein